jgi:hypothetical protein
MLEPSFPELVVRIRSAGFPAQNLCENIGHYQTLIGNGTCLKIRAHILIIIFCSN